MTTTPRHQPAPSAPGPGRPRLRLGVFALLLSGCTADCTPSNPSNACEATGQTRATLTGLDVGIVRYEPARQVDVFVPFVDGGDAIITPGFQGSDMVAVTLAVTGAGFDECVPQHTTIRQAAGAVIWDEPAPQVATARPGGVWWVGPALMIMDGVSSGTVANVTATVLDRTVTRVVTLYAEGQAPPDARTDAAPPDAAVDAEPVDAAVDAPAMVAP